MNKPRMTQADCDATWSGLTAPERGVGFDTVRAGVTIASTTNPADAIYSLRPREMVYWNGEPVYAYNVAFDPDDSDALQDVVEGMMTAILRRQAER